MPESGIYKITNIKNKHVYIGSAVNLTKRIWQHKHGVNSSPHLKNAIEKYGLEDFIFEVVEYCNKENLIKREQFYLDQYDPKQLYNIALIAKSGLGLYWSEERKLSKSGSGNHFFGKHHTKEWKKQASIRMQGNKNSKGGNPIGIEKMLKGMRKYWSNPENRKAAGARKKLWWQKRKDS